MKPIMLIVPLAIFAAACAASLTVDGYDAVYIDRPADIERYPHYAYRGAVVYEVGGRYYREHNGRWIVYRERPRDLEITVRR
jgi:hypothetical protein